MQGKWPGLQSSTACHGPSCSGRIVIKMYWHVNHLRNVVSAKAGLEDSRVCGSFLLEDQDIVRVSDAP